MRSPVCSVCSVCLVCLVCLVYLVCLVGRIGRPTRRTQETRQTEQTGLLISFASSRFQASHLYRESSLGWIPKEWEVQSLRHFVPIVAYGVSSGLGENPSGISVLRRNNLTAGRIDITDIEFSDAVEARLLTLKVGDVLFNRTHSLEHVGKTAMWRGALAAASFASYLVRLDVDV